MSKEVPGIPTAMRPREPSGLCLMLATVTRGGTIGVLESRPSRSFASVGADGA
ncbi:hypothetical protein [Solimonas sp. SE-A11]|uniref:hypothetical protein n=1 Tax=Solimonas sp. SE-A11 TaxID=3054954 RepID=UPI00259CDFC6|nr:hypothetical protein [Solimonas sp. SE-A11]MDM4768703.1 hypothetical protein [Solimonas sp. SE-A11]